MKNAHLYNVVDLFSGAGGMSFGFHAHSTFQILAAADAEVGKPTAGAGKLQCNSTYSLNIGIQPAKIDLAAIPPHRLRQELKLPDDAKVHVLSTCPPCTGFSRTNPQNHLRDDERNGLVVKSAAFAVALDADIVVMENARELLQGNFDQHYDEFRDRLECAGYNVFGKTYMLTQFGLPQIRERAIVIAAKKSLPLYTLENLWDGWAMMEEALTVRHTFSTIRSESAAQNLVPNFASDTVRKRISAIPRDGGSWMDLLTREDSDSLLTGSMKRIAAAQRFGSYPDVYGRMAWDKPAPTIKRECAHVGNGRYAHPVEDRLCTVREMASLQGFPKNFQFNGAALSNIYRHIGDAVPPSISFQLAHLSNWMLSGAQPEIDDILLPKTNLRTSDLVHAKKDA